MNGITFLAICQRPYGITFSQKMNEAELIKEITAEEAKRKQLAKLKQYQGETVRPISDEREPVRTDETVAKQVGLGGEDT